MNLYARHAPPKNNQHLNIIFKYNIGKKSISKFTLKIISSLLKVPNGYISFTEITTRVCARSVHLLYLPTAFVALRRSFKNYPLHIRTLWHNLFCVYVQLYVCSFEGASLQNDYIKLNLTQLFIHTLVDIFHVQTHTHTHKHSGTAD